MLRFFLPLLAWLPACTTPELSLDVVAGPSDIHTAIAQVRSREEAQVRVAWGRAGELDHATPWVQVQAGETAEIPVLGLAAGREWTLQAQTQDQVRSALSLYTTEALAPDYPRCQVMDLAPPGTFGPDEVVCTNARPTGDEAQGFYHCVDRTGEPVWTLDNQGETLLTLIPLRDGGFASVATTTDLVSVYDTLGQVLIERRSMWFASRTRFEHHFIDMHELIQLDQGPWEGALAFLTATTDDDEQGEWLIGGGIIVWDPDADEVLWDWSSHGAQDDAVPIDAALAYQRHGVEGYSRDWQHTNGLVHGLEDDGRQFFWLSLRNQDWLIKVDVDTDEVVWRLGYGGDFALVQDLDGPDSPPADPSAWFYHQHAPELLSHWDGRARFLVFDNGNARYDAQGQVTWEPTYSRVLELEIDEHTLRATPVWQYGPADEDDPEHFFTDGMGDADMLWDGARVQFVAGWASPPWIGEVSYPEGELLWKLVCPQAEELYRVWWAPSLYEAGWWYEVER